MPPERRGGAAASALPPVRQGPALALASIYALFALAAGARSLVQLATHAGDAPIPYALSAAAAAVYLAGAIVLHRQGKHATRTLRAICTIELAGVLIVGTASLARPSAFPDATVWSQYGAGYGCIPLVLPLLGLALTTPIGRVARVRTISRKLAKSPRPVTGPARQARDGPRRTERNA